MTDEYAFAQILILLYDLYEQLKVTTAFFVCSPFYGMFVVSVSYENQRKIPCYNEFDRDPDN